MHDGPMHGTMARLAVALEGDHGSGEREPEVRGASGERAEARDETAPELALLGRDRTAHGRGHNDKHLGHITIRFISLAPFSTLFRRAVRH